MEHLHNVVGVEIGSGARAEADYDDVEAVGGAQYRLDVRLSDEIFVAARLGGVRSDRNYLHGLPPNCGPPRAVIVRVGWAVVNEA
jgi:hypothetical protein